MVNRRFWLGILVMVLVFGMAVTGCEEDSKEDKKNEVVIESISLYKWADGAQIRIYYKNMSNTQLYDNNDNFIGTTEWNTLIQDFIVTVNGTLVTLDGVGLGFGGITRLSFTGGPPYIVGDNYLVKVIYTANPNRKIKDNGIVNSFTIERTLECYN